MAKNELDAVRAMQEQVALLVRQQALRILYKYTVSD